MYEKLLVAVGVSLLLFLTGLFIYATVQMVAETDQQLRNTQFDEYDCPVRSPIGITPSGSMGVRIGDSSMGISIDDGSIGIMP